MAAKSTLPETNHTSDSHGLQDVADAIVRRAQRQGHIVPKEIRDELAQAGVAGAKWKEVVALSRPVLSLRRGRYYYVPAISAVKQQDQKQQQDIHRAVRRII